MTATALAAVAAIGGLWAQAVTTYWSQQTAKDQLQQTREEGEKEKRAQAETVFVWTEGDPTDWEVHVLNRSPDPVSRLTAGLIGSVTLKTGDPAVGSASYLVDTSRLAPCTELVFSRKTLSNGWVPVGAGETRNSVLGGAVVDRIQYIKFRDRDGQIWRRSADGKLTRSTNLFGYDAAEWDTTLVDNPEVKKVAACGGGD
ncbi:hypothetical protein [Streptomyces sp. NPDC001975]